HFALSELLRGDAKFDLPSLGREHDAVLRFVVDFELRVVGAHVTLATRGRQAGDLDGRSVPGVTGGAVADRPVRVRLADPVALGKATDAGRLALQGHHSIPGAPARARGAVFPEGKLPG